VTVELAALRRDLGGRLRDFREKAGLTLEMLSEKTRVSRSALSDLERGVGRRAPDKEKVGRYLDVCGQHMEKALADERSQQIRDLYSAVVTTIDRAGDQPRAASRPVLRTFFNHLLQSHGKLFAGRGREIQKINDFIRTAESGYVFLEGRSGYGKTSLLAQLVRADPAIAYHFISQGYKGTDPRFDPTRAHALMSNLYQQLEPSIFDPGSDDIAARLRALLAVPAAKATTVVIDAVDEIDGHPNYLLGLLPRQLPRGYVFVISARTQGERQYLAEVGLDRSDIGLHLTLPGLSVDAVVELLRQAGPTAKALADRLEFVGELHEKSDGDPFYLRFLVEDVEARLLTPGNINRSPSGLRSYLDAQLEQLNRSAYEQQHRDILGLILDASAPLSKADLIALVPGLDRLNFRTVTRDIHRFLLVHDQHYTFCHDRFKEYFAMDG
jgi:transcriptional regulator with XRE-family HTH domain